MHWFVLSLLIAGVVMVCSGDARARWCAVLMMLIVVLGDPLVVKTLDCLGLGGGSAGRMPSADAANWFAVTLVAFVFYRRSLWFLLPLAVAAGVWRISRGVAPPSEVLAGAGVGAGYAAAVLAAAEMLWTRAGPKWFPLWHVQWPSILKAGGSKQVGRTKTQDLPASVDHSSTDSHWLRLGYLVIVLALITRWIYIASGTIQLSQDEAYQWLWSKHLAWSYYSKPLGIALIQFAGTGVFGDTEFGVRFFSPLFAAILGVMVLRFLAREIGARPTFWLLLIVAATPLLCVGSVLMTIDPPLVLCWTWAMVAGWRAVQPDGRTSHWLVVGLAMGLGFLCKYTGLFQVICWMIYFALQPSARPHLRRAGPWLALLIFLLCTLPVIWWNTQHHWITLNDVGGDAGLHSRWHPTLRYFWDFLFSEMGLLNPIFFWGALWAMFAFWPRRRERPLWLYLFCMGGPVFLGYWLWSFHSRILPNWIAVAIVPLFCLMTAYWNERRRLVKPFLTAGLVLGFLAVALLHQPSLIGRITGRLLPGEKDPLRRVRAWKQSAQFVERERKKLQRAGKPAFIICGHYGITGLYSFYLPAARKTLRSEPLVYAEDFNQAHNEFYFWPAYNYLKERKGQNAIFVAEADLYRLGRDWPWKWLTGQPLKRTAPPAVRLPPTIAQQFAFVTNWGEHDIKLHGRVYHRIHVWACYDLK